MGMAHQSLNRPEIIPFVQKGCSKGVANYMRMNPLLNQSFLCHGFDQAINRLWCDGSFLIGSVLPKGIEYGMIRVRSIPIGF
jgi:hypothetical protein